MQHCAANDRVHARSVPRKRGEIADHEVAGGKRGRQLRGTAAHLIDGPGILVDAEAVKARSQEVMEIAAVAAAGVEDAAARVEPPLEQLVEQVNVDFPERIAQFGARRHE